MTADLSYFLQDRATELTLGLENGLRVAIKQWGDEHADVRILACHGWMDSSASYDKLAPLIVSSTRMKCRIVCMDFIGHGKSSHASKDAKILLTDRCFEMFDVADALGWDTFHLMAHSMGGAAATLSAGAQPARIESLILLDMLGPWPWNASAPEILELALNQNKRQTRRQRRVYPSFDMTVQKYLDNNPYMKEESARILMQRATQEVEVWETSGSENDRRVQRKEKGFVFRHDPRLMGRSHMAFDQHQVLEFCRRITCPVLVFLAVNDLRRKQLQEGGHWSQVCPLFGERVRNIRDIRVRFVEGSHHLHLDQVIDIYKDVIDFIVDPTLVSSHELLPEYLPGWQPPLKSKL